MHEKKRSISSHVGSRCYRSPEVILVQKHYDFASDMWSIGCILYELMNLVARPKDETPYKHKELFSGDSCFPLSPVANSVKSNLPKQLISKKDQLRKILEKT